MKEISRLIFQWNSYETLGLFHEKQDIPSKASILTIFVKFRFDGGIYIPLSDRIFTSAGPGRPSDQSTLGAVDSLSHTHQ